MSANEKSFSIDVNGSWELSIRDLWPDGDEPENPTAEDAQRVIADYIKGRSFASFMRDWGMSDDLTLDVEGRTVYPRVSS